jgi:hypothetical protein
MRKLQAWPPSLGNAGRHSLILIDALRRVSGVGNLTAVFFRRTMPRITNPEALWDESLNQFASGSAPSFSMLQG